MQSYTARCSRYKNKYTNLVCGKTAVGRNYNLPRDSKEHLQKHHLYVCPQDSAELNRHILFREYLRAHPKAVREYGDIKLKGAALYPYDIDRYI